jgi:cytochrome c oxidase subunit 3
MSLTLPAPEAGHEHHDHPEWLAHHFEDAEQQFDAGKLGMWLFLVTEVLFFSGMFCAYALYRSQHPEIFVFASAYLNKFLGAINTGVLLFSSLTMAWAVRSAQLSQHRTTVGMLAATLSCAAIFLGVKAVEYTHKWNEGLLPAMMYTSQMEGHSNHSLFWLGVLCVPAGVVLFFATIWYCTTWVARDRFQREISGPILVAALCFFGGVGLGYILTEPSVETDKESHAAEVALAKMAPVGDVEENIASHHSKTESAAADPVSLTGMYDSQAFPTQVRTNPQEQEVPYADVNQKGKAGLFFSIYYAMTGVHAFHILGGMVVLTWLIVKAARKEFHSQYFGPVDNVGLYWHLVDFIWIYLFPLLYLIT